MQHETFPDRRNNILGPLKPIQAPQRPIRGPLRAAQALPHRQIAPLGRKRATQTVDRKKALSGQHMAFQANMNFLDRKRIL